MLLAASAFIIHICLFIILAYIIFQLRISRSHDRQTDLIACNFIEAGYTAGFLNKNDPVSGTSLYFIFFPRRAAYTIHDDTGTFIRCFH